MKRIVCFLTIISITICFCSCSFGPKPEDTIYKLEDAYNNYDMEAMLECYEPRIQKIYNGIFEIGGALLGGINLMTIMGAAGGLVSLYGEDLLGSTPPQIKITINEQEEISDEEVKMNITIKYIYDDEITAELSEDVVTEETLDVILVLEDKNWYIKA